MNAEENASANLNAKNVFLKKLQRVKYKYYLQKISQAETEFNPVCKYLQLISVLVRFTGIKYNHV